LTSQFLSRFPARVCGIFSFSVASKKGVFHNAFHNKPGETLKSPIYFTPAFFRWFHPPQPPRRGIHPINLFSLVLTIRRLYEPGA
jgi:hypothetical protein